MARSQKPRKKYVPKDIRTPMLVGVDLVFRPLEAILDQIEHDGTINASRRGVPMFKAGDGIWYASGPAIEGIITHLEMYCTRHKKTLPLDALRELRIALDYDMPVFKRTIDGIKESLPIIRKELSFANPDDQVDLLTQAQIKEAFELNAA